MTQLGVPTGDACAIFAQRSGNLTAGILGVMLYDSSQYARGQRELKTSVTEDARIVCLAGLIATSLQSAL